MFHMQTLSIISSGLVQSEETNDFVDTSSSIGSIQLPNLSCVLGLDNTFDVIMFSFARIPFFILVGSVCYHFGTGHMQNKAVFITLHLLFLVYYSVATDVFGVFGCTVYDNGDEMWYLNFAPWIVCSPASTEYKKLIGLSVPIFFIFLLGFPAFVWWKVKVMFESPGYEPGARYGFLYQSYKETYKYWEFVIIARRLAFSFVISVVPYTSPSAFFLLLVIVIQASIWMQKEYLPYNSKLENQMELSSLYLIFVSFFLALLSSFLDSQDWIAPLMISLNVIWLTYYSSVSFFIPFFQNNPIKRKWIELKRKPYLRKVEMYDPLMQ